MKRLGIFGGTFNPIHFGHLRVAVEVRELFFLDAVLFIPSAQPPHKEQSDIAPANDRRHMTQLAIQSYPFFHLSTIEIDRKGLSYTIDTIKKLQQLYTEDNIQLFYMIGLDAFLAIHTWKYFQKLFDEIPFIVMSRPVSGEQSNSMNVLTNTLYEYVQKTISNDYSLDNACHCISHMRKQSIHCCQVTSLDISASQIRRLLIKNQSIHFLLPDDVIDYINHKQLYRGKQSI